MLIKGASNKECLFKDIERAVNTTFEEVKDKMDDIITIVSGLPRSGTSLMMQMLEAGGLKVVTDNERKADEDNPRGYFEFERVKKIKEDSSWLNDVEGKAVKMISDLLYYLPSDRIYRVIFMERELREVLASQKKMLARRGIKDDTNDEEMENLFHNHLAKLGQWLEEQKNIDVLYLSYNEIIKDSLKNAKVVDDFLGNILNVKEMGKVVEEKLYRNR